MLSVKANFRPNKLNCLHGPMLVYMLDWNVFLFWLLIFQGLANLIRFEAYGHGSYLLKFHVSNFDDAVGQNSLLLCQLAIFFLRILHDSLLPF